MSAYKRINEFYLENADDNNDDYSRIMNSVKNLILQDKGVEAIKMIEEEYKASTDLPLKRLFVPYFNEESVVVIADLESDPIFDLSMINGKIADIGIEDLFEDEEKENQYISDLLKEINTFLHDNEYPDLKEEERVYLIRNVLKMLKFEG